MGIRMLGDQRTSQGLARWRRCGRHWRAVLDTRRAQLAPSLQDRESDVSDIVAVEVCSSNPTGRRTQMKPAA